MRVKFELFQQYEVNNYPGIISILLKLLKSPFSFFQEKSTSCVARAKVAAPNFAHHRCLFHVWADFWSPAEPGFDSPLFCHAWFIIPRVGGRGVGCRRGESFGAFIRSNLTWNLLASKFLWKASIIRKSRNFELEGWLGNDPIKRFNKSLV